MKAIFAMKYGDCEDIQEVAVPPYFNDKKELVCETIWIPTGKSFDLIKVLNNCNPIKFHTYQNMVDNINYFYSNSREYLKYKYKVFNL